MPRRAMGSEAQLLGITEVTYGTAPGGNWAKLPFIGAPFGVEEKLIQDDTLTGRREELDPSQDIISVQDSLDVPLDLNDFGQWLYWFHGAETVSGSGPYVHTFHSGALGTPKSYATELGFLDIGKYFVRVGNVVDSLAFDLQPSGLAACTIGTIAQNETYSGASGGGTFTEAAYKRFSQLSGTATLGGTAIAGITGAKFTLANHLEAARVIRGDGLIEGIDPGMFEASGDITLRFEDTAVFDDAKNLTPLVLAFGFAIDANDSLFFTFNRAFLGRPKSNVKGAMGVSVTYPFRAAHDTGTGFACTTVLKNTVVAAYS